MDKESRSTRHWPSGGGRSPTSRRRTTRSSTRPSHDNEDPLLWIHLAVEGALAYTTLFFIPSHAPFDLYRYDYRARVKLYIKRVFITENEKELRR